MNILLFTIDYPPAWGGVARYYSMVYENWPRFPQGNVNAKKLYLLDNSGGKLIKGKIPFISWMPSVYALYRELKDKKIDKVIVGQVLPLGMAVYICKLFFNFEYVVFFHGMDYNYAKRKARKARAMQAVLQEAETIFAANGYLGGMIMRDYPAYIPKVRIIHPGVQRDIPYSLKRTQELRKEYRLEGKTVMFSLGRLVRRKGFDKAIEAFARVARTVPELEYVIAGKGEDEDYLRSVIARCEEAISSRVRLVGGLSEEDKWAWYDLCDFFIMASRDQGGDFEGFGIVYLEANLAGKPVIAGASGGVGEAVKEMSNGLLVDPEDSSDIENAILLLSRDKALRERLGSQGRDSATSLSWRSQVEKLYELL